MTAASFDEIQAIYDGLSRRARATLGVSSFGMQVMTLPANRAATRTIAMMQTLTMPTGRRSTSLAGSATLVAGDQRVELRPGMMVRPSSFRRVLPGPDGVRCITLGGVPGSLRDRRYLRM